MSKFRYLALGDSYTIGESVSAAERFPAQLTAQLRAGGWDVANPEIIARTGWTTDELEQAIAAQPPRGPFELVTLLIGVNNQYRGRSPENYEPEFVRLLELAIAFAGHQAQRVVVVSIPDWGVTPMGQTRQNVSQEIDAFNRVNRAEAEKRGARYVDITAVSRAARHDAALTAPDDLHPSDSMYARWTQFILPAAQAALGQPHTEISS